VPDRLNHGHFRVGRDDLEVAFQVALELAERVRRVPDDAARSAAAKIIAAGASRPVVLSLEEQAALGQVIDVWEAEAVAVAVRRPRERLP
jgi:hypothetical protein